MQNSSRELIRQSKRLSYGSTSWARRHRQILSENLGSLRATADAQLVFVLARCCWNILSAAVNDYIDRYVPRAVDAKTWERIGPFVRDSVALAAPKTPYSAEVLIGRAARYVAWSDKKGWPLDAETIWSIQGIDLFVNDKKLGLNEDTRRNYRGWLMKMAHVLLPEENGEVMRTIRTATAMAAPYDDYEMSEFRRWAASQRDPLKQYRAMLMLVLCAGAGLRPVDFEELTAEHIEAMSGGGYIVHIQGKDARSVPLLSEWDEWMEVLLTRVPASHETLWGPPNKARRYSSLSAFTQTSTGAPPTSSRLRETWAVAVLGSIANIKSIFRAAGVEKFDKLAQLLHFVDDVSDEEYVRFLRQAGKS